MFSYDFEAAVFDMDGTLLDSMRYWRFTSLEFLLAHNLPVKNDDLVKMLDTSSRRLLFDIAERDGLEIGTLDEVVGQLEAFMARHYVDDVPLKDAHVKRFLEKLKEKGVHMCVATASTKECAQSAFKRHGVDGYFDFITDNYETTLTKKDPEFFAEIARRMNTVPERCVVFEDALYAMEAAKKAGCRVMAIEDFTARLQKDKILETADWYVKSFSELL